MDDATWARLQQRVRAILAEVAASRSTITYEDLQARLGTRIPTGGAHDLAALLRDASVASDDAGRGLVSAVVVRESGRPGGGWFRLAETRGRDVADPDAAWQTELERVWSSNSRS